MPTGLFKPGDKVPETGIYTASHYQHRLPHEVFAVQGEEFPVCRRCGPRASFSLFQSVSHVDADQDFSRSSQAKKKAAAKAGLTGSD